MTYARIYSPSKTSMQSGKAKTDYWLFHFNTSDTKVKDPIMGWNSTESTDEQISLRFTSLKKALNYASQQGIKVIVENKNLPKIQIKSYSDNFRHDKPRG